MVNDIIWLRYYIKNYLVRYLKYKMGQMNKAFGWDLSLHSEKKMDIPGNIAGKKHLDIDQVNQVIAEAIRSGEPFWAGRYGGMEMGMIASVLEERHFGKSGEKRACMNGLCNNAGFFPNDVKLADQFADLMLACCREVDLLGTWDGLFMEDYVIREFMPDSRVTWINFLEPWQTFFLGGKEKKPWSGALSGKKVLVIHPFTETIRHQYQNKREKLFTDIYGKDEILPEFTLLTLKAVQTQAGAVDSRFKDWFEALQWMTEEAAGIDFDVAIIGCGAYGFPLAAEVKKMGKAAIHLGGATQLMFGIRGKRWDGYDRMETLYNESWVRPSEDERIDNLDMIENGCYW